MTTNQKIPPSDEAWDSGQLGQDENFVKLVEEDLESQIDEALELQLISVRLQKSLIQDLKFIAELNGIGYQPLMRQVLVRFADCEKKRILKEAASQNRELAQAAEAAENENNDPPRKRKTG